MAKKKRNCTIQNCERVYLARGFCQKHYGRFYRHGDPTVKNVRSTDKVCEAVVKGKKCGKEHNAKGYCSNHYASWKVWGDPNGKRPPAKKPRKYKYICKPNHPNSTSSGMIAEHRWVMSESLGRALDANENVHHKNGDSRDNRIQNLELWNTYQPAGQRVEDKVQFALEILAKYAPDRIVTTS